MTSGGTWSQTKRGAKLGSLLLISAGGDQLNKHRNCSGVARGGSEADAQFRLQPSTYYGRICLREGKCMYVSTTNS